VSASFAASGNYTAAAGTGTLIVDKAAPVVTVTESSFTYGSGPYQAQVVVTGVGGEALGGASVTYDGGTGLPFNAGTYAVLATYAGSSNYAASTGTGSLIVRKATPTFVVPGGTVTYDAQPHAAVAILAGHYGDPLEPYTLTYNGLSEPPVNAGTYQVVATYGGAANYDAASATGTLTIAKATIALTVAGATLTYDGQPHPAVVNATGVAGEAVGPVVVTYNGSSAPPANGGTYAVEASFAGSVNYAAATKATTITVNPAAPTVSVTGGTFTYDGQPHPAVATATGVAGESLSPVNVTYWRDGFGWFAVPIATGTYEVAATFQGSASYLPKTERTTVVIGRATPVLTWNAPGSIVYGTALGAAQLDAVSSVPGSFSYSPAAGTRLSAGAGQGLTATFVPADPANYTVATGSTALTVTPAPLTVRAVDAVKPIGAPLPLLTAAFVGLVNGESPASLGGSLGFGTTATQASPVGAYPVVPAGLSSPNYAIVFVSGTLTIVKGSVSVAVSASPEPSGYNMPMTFTATVSAVAPAAGSPSGTVRFFDGPTLIGSATVSGGAAALTTAGLDPGVRTIEARYDGDAAFGAGTGSSSHTVNSAASTPVVSLSSSRNPSTAGQSVTLTANVSMSAGPVSGSVAFYDGATLLGSSAISAGRATVSTTALAAGSHAITARYLGGAAPPSTSPLFVQAVGLSGWKNRTTTTTLAASANPSTLGEAVVLTATVTGSSSTTPTGRVLFMVNGQVVGAAQGVAVTAVSGTSVQATLSVPGLAHGRHSITATYLGDATYKGSSAALPQMVD
jgi:hypothetical protein